MLQLFHQARRSLTLKVGRGRIHYQEGEIINAEHRGQTGEEALRTILRLPSGDVESAPPQPRERTIQRPFQNLLLDILRQLDENERDNVEQKTFTDSLWPWSPDEDSEPPQSKLESKAEKETNMGKIDDAVRRVVESVDGAVACGVVDLDTGMLLGVHNAAAYTSTLNEVVAAATTDMFRGAAIGRIEQMVRQHRGLTEDGEHYFDEIQITSKHNYHFAKALKGGKAVIMLVTKKTTNVGMGWAQLKSAIPSVEPLVP
jgi:hypothetical protein